MEEVRRDRKGGKCKEFIRGRWRMAIEEGRSGATPNTRVAFNLRTKEREKGKKESSIHEVGGGKKFLLTGRKFTQKSESTYSGGFQRRFREELGGTSFGRLEIPWVNYQDRSEGITFNTELGGRDDP